MAAIAIPAIAQAGSAIMSYFGQQSATDKNIEAQKAINEENWQHSLYMARNSVTDRVDDAKRAGINPLYALGAPTMSFAPAQAGAMANRPNPMAGTASALSAMGQDLSRAALANESPQSKVAGVVQAQGIASNTLDLEEKRLRLELLRARIANLTQPGTPPGQPFVVPENSKPEQRPPLMAGGMRWDTAPDTSPAKAWEDQYGDDGPVSWLVGMGLAARDSAYNLGKYVHGRFGPLGSGTPAIERAAAESRWRRLNSSNFDAGY